jgi:hypothetical protein
VALRLHRAVLAVVVKRAAGKEEMTLMNKLARMSVAERRHMIDDFLAEVFEGINAARAPRWGAAWNLPDDPSPEQVDAWVELAELVSDPDFPAADKAGDGHWQAGRCQGRAAGLS